MKNKVQKLVESASKLVGLAMEIPDLSVTELSDFALKLEQELEQLDTCLTGYVFENTTLEVAFFKRDFMPLLATLLYLKEAVCIEIDTPIYKESLKKYYEKVAVRLQSTKKKHLKQFMCYCAESFEEDAVLYQRPTQANSTKLLGNTFKNVSDTVFMQAKFRAIDQQLNEMKRFCLEEEYSATRHVPQYCWLASKVEYVEFLYLLAHSNLFGALPVNMKELNRLLGGLFGVDLEEKEVYRTFTDIKRRKNKKSKVLPRLELSFQQLCAKEEKQ